MTNNKLETTDQSYLDTAVNTIRSAKAAAARSVNLAMVYAYFEIGRIIVEEEQGGNAPAGYRKQVLANVSERLTAEFGRGFSMTNVEQMRKFYRVYASDKIGQTLSEEFGRNLPVTTTGRKIYLSWSHYLFLMRIDDVNARHFYEIEAATGNWSLKELKRQFNSALFERLALSRDKDGVMALARQVQIVEKPADVIKDPFVLEFLELDERASYSETDLEAHIIDHLQDFLRELGKGFLFDGRQVRISFDEQHFFVDLVCYNRILRCYVLFDLKIGAITHQDLGQMQMYVNYYDRRVKLDEENKTIGILLCQEKSNAVVEMTLPEDNDQIFASKYQTVLPRKEDLKRLMAEAAEEVESEEVS